MTSFPSTYSPDEAKTHPCHPLSRSFTISVQTLDAALGEAPPGRVQRVCVMEMGYPEPLESSGSSVLSHCLAPQNPVDLKAQCLTHI